MAVRDDSAPAFTIGERLADHAGLTGGELGHGVEQVRESAHAVLERLLYLLLAGVAVPAADDKALARQFGDEVGMDGLRRQCEQGFAVWQWFQLVDNLTSQLAQLACIMNATAFLVEKGAFDMNAEHAGYGGSHRLFHRLQPLADDIQLVTDQGWQQSRRAERSVC